MNLNMTLIFGLGLLFSLIMVQFSVDAQIVSFKHVMECKPKFPPKNANPDAFESCVYQKAGIQEQNGQINFSKLRQALLERYHEMNFPIDTNTLDNALKKCKDVHGTDAVDTITKLHQCINQNFPSN